VSEPREITEQAVQAARFGMRRRQRECAGEAALGRIEFTTFDSQRDIAQDRHRTVRKAAQTLRLDLPAWIGPRHIDSTRGAGAPPSRHCA
jgi:hypothetical protein